jgi:hypothetical protein
MVRLSSKDASLLMDVLEQNELTPKERLKLLEDAGPKVLEIGKALIDPNQAITDPEVKEAVESINLWADTTRRIEEQRHSALSPQDI